jgi:hypothetical protein
MIKYQIEKWHPKIIAVNVVKETEKTYTTSRPNWAGDRMIEDRFSRDKTPLYETFDEAKVVLIDR